MVLTLNLTKRDKKEQLCLGQLYDSEHGIHLGDKRIDVFEFIYLLISYTQMTSLINLLLSKIEQFRV